MKRILAILLFLTMLFSFVACGEDAAEAVCKNCNKEISSESLFCSHCGAEVGEEEDAQNEEKQLSEGEVVESTPTHQNNLPKQEQA